MTGFPVTTSAYGRTIPELLVDELEEGFDIVVRREIAVEVGNTSGPVGQIAKNASDVLTRDAGDDHHEPEHRPPFGCSFLCFRESPRSRGAGGDSGAHRPRGGGRQGRQRPGAV